MDSKPLRFPGWTRPIGFFTSLIAVWGWWHLVFSMRGIFMDDCFQVSWTDHLMPYLNILMSTLSIVLIRGFAGSFALSLGVFALCMAIMEFVMLVPVYSLYGSGLTYRSPCDSDDRYHTWTENSGHVLDSEEFSHPRTTNSLGFSDFEWPVEKPAGIFRVIALGDSFTEGAGAPVDSSYPAQLSKMLISLFAGDGCHYEVFNAGSSGSDPLFGFVNLTERLMVYRPDLVLQTVSLNDIFTDFYDFGGFERFDVENGYQVVRADFPRRLASVSRVFELLIRHRYPLYDDPCKDNQALRWKRRRIITDMVSRYDSLAVKSDLTVVFVLLPMGSDMVIGHYESEDMEFLSDLLRDAQRLHAIDLLPGYVDHLSLTAGTSSDLYWQKDGHHNPYGYWVMASAVLDGLVRSGLVGNACDSIAHN